MYPQGHPSLEPAAVRLLDRLNPLLASRGSLSLGVARDQLVIEGVGTDPGNPVLRELALRLHRHHLGAMSFRAGATFEEVRSALYTLAADAERAGEPIGLREADAIPTWPHVELHALSYGRLEFADDEAEKEILRRTRESQATQLWVGLARAAMAADAFDKVDESAKPSVVARAIDDHGRGAAYDQVIVGYMLQIAEELRAGGGRETEELQKRMSRLVNALDPATLEQLLEMGGDTDQRRRFLLSAAESLAVDSVLELVRAASQSEEEGVSHSFLRVLQKLAQHTGSASVRRRVEADAALREQVAELIHGWSLEDPNPGAYGRALARMSAAESLYAVSPEQRYRPEPRRMIEMALEVDEIGEGIGQAIDEIVNDGSLEWLLQLLHTSDPSPVVHATWDRLQSADVMKQVLRTEPLDTEVLDLMLQQVGMYAATPMLDTLIESESSQTRRLLLHRLTRLGPAVGPLAIERLGGAPWYVERNVLRLLGDLGQLPESFDPERYLQHTDARVRVEAVRILLSNPERRGRAIGHALADGDQRIVRMGLTAALEGCPAGAVPQVVSRALSDADEGIRTLAVRVLASARDPMALRALLRLTAPRRSFFRRARAVANTPTYLAALRALRAFGGDPDAQRILDRAAQSSDPEIAEAARPASREGEGE